MPADPQNIFSRVYATTNGLLTTRTYSPYGVLRDRWIHTHPGQRKTLVETARRINSKWRCRVDNPDVYRSVVGTRQVALEQSNMAPVLTCGRRNPSRSSLNVRRAAIASIFVRIMPLWLQHFREHYFWMPALILLPRLKLVQTVVCVTHK
jgi:hypothetical protein